MSYNEAQTLITLPAGADLSASAGLFVKLSNASGVARVVVAANAEDAIGVVVEGGKAAGEPSTIAIGGVTKVVAGGNITAGGLVSSSAAAKAEAAATSDYILGYALESAVANDVISVLLAIRGKNL